MVTGEMILKKNFCIQAGPLGSGTRVPRLHFLLCSFKNMTVLADLIKNVMKTSFPWVIAYYK